MLNKEKVIFQDALRTWGKTSQVFMSIEEMGELIQALSKNFRGKENLDNIAEEITDVEIMIDQLKLIFDVEKRCSEIRVEKVDGLKNRLEVLSWKKVRHT